ncbi:MAG: DUF58 domain-containing protein [Oscillospiraceae bacterium]|nr:DUF58 domain-containing protein [Oscillospiraceae bacterium]
MQQERKYTTLYSSLLVSPFAIAAAFVVSFIMNRAALPSVAVFLFALAVVGLTARVWGLFALRNIKVSLVCERTVIPAGETAEITYTVENNKLLPLTWMEICQDLPANGCMSPDAGFSLHTYAEDEAEAEGKSAVFRKRILFLPGFGSVSWDTVWSAERRGVYEVSKLSLRSGDGFGLSRSVRDTSAENRVFIVWPKIIPVKTEPFFRNLWQGGAGRRGYVEDITVLRGLRDYLPSDPWKRIDRRMTARSDELMVRQFETILPSTVHFVFDAASFSGLSEDNNELEDCISILASLILELHALSIKCGLSLPAGPDFPSVDISPEDTSADAADIINSLAAFNADAAFCGFDEDLIESLSQTVGQLWLIAYSGSRLTCAALADKLETSGFRALCFEAADPGPLSGRPLLPVRELKKDGIK